MRLCTKQSDDDEATDTTGAETGLSLVVLCARRAGGFKAKERVTDEEETIQRPKESPRRNSIEYYVS